MLILQAGLSYILKTGITPGSQCQTSLTWKKTMMTLCMAGLMTLALAAMCEYVMSGVDSSSDIGFS